MSSSPAKHRVPDLITTKRNGGHLSQDEIQHFIEGIVSGDVQDVQAGAMLMSIFFRGMTTHETANLTRAMLDSGETLSWPEEWRGRVVDKHSTGGVGDKISLPLAPALAACGMKVPMISGRGLGFSGGTLDKLESIPGFQVSLSGEEMLRILEEAGCCIVGQTNSLVPADRMLYAHRDVTATVESIPLVAASIISKKAAENLDALVLDVKYGKAAFMQTMKQAETLAKTMVGTSKELGIKTVALLTKMDHPIGLTVGNALEVSEALECLHGRGPNDLVELVTELGGHLLHCNGIAECADEGSQMIARTLHDGSACAKFQQMLTGQGVDPTTAHRLCERDAEVFTILPRAKCVESVRSDHTGYIQSIDAHACAVLTHGLGAGRSKAGEAINYSVGLELKMTVGDYINKGEEWVSIHHDGFIPKEKLKRLQEALVVSSDPVSPQTLQRVAEVVTTD